MKRIIKSCGLVLGILWPIACNAVNPQAVTVNVAPAVAGLANGLYSISDGDGWNCSGPCYLDEGFVRTSEYSSTGGPAQQWTWNQTTLVNAPANIALKDNGDGTVAQVAIASGDTFAIAVATGGYTVNDVTTGRYMEMGTPASSCPSVSGSVPCVPVKMGTTPYTWVFTSLVQHISSISLPTSSFIAGTAGTVGTASAALSIGSFTGTFSLQTSGADHAGAGCTNNPVFSISSAGALSVTNAGVAQSYPGVCVVATESGISNSPYVQAFTVTGQAPGAVTGVALSNQAFTAGTAGTVGTATASVSSGTFAGSYALRTSGTDNTGTACANDPVFSIDSSSGVLSVTSGGAVQSYPGVCVVATEGSSSYANAFTLTGTQAGVGGCPGGDSPYVPAGFKCVLADTDEFNSNSVDTSKWILSGGVGGCAEGGGYLVASMSPSNANGCGMRSTFTVPDAPAYLEWRRQFVPYQIEGALSQFWTTSLNVPSGTIYAETDMDMGIDCGDGFYLDNRLCSGLIDWLNGNTQGLFNFTRDGPDIYNTSAFHIIGAQLFKTPTPNGKLAMSVDGVVVKTWCDGGSCSYGWPVNSAIYTSPSISSGGQSVFIYNLFCNSIGGVNCANPNGSPPVPTVTVNWDYFRIYTPTGN